jgi:oligopeptide transport system substrate-binding protein
MDVERARALLAEAGFPGGRGFPSVDYLTIAAETDKLIAEALQQMWRKNLGVEVGISQQEFKTYLQSINNTTLNYSLARGRWLPEYPDALSVLEIMQGSNGINGTGFSSRTYDSLLEAADRQPDAPDRLAGLARAETYLLQQSPVAPVYFGTSAFLVHPAVHGWNRTPLGFHNYKNVWLEP